MKKHFLQFNGRRDLGRSLFSLATILGLAGSGIFMFNSGMFHEIAFANDLTYQTSVPVEFTFNDYLNVTVSGDLVISDLAPGTFADSNHIAVTVNTNNAYGYTLSATVGDTNNSSRDLRHSGYGTGGNTEVFGSLDLDANLTQETFSTGSTYDNKWGFSTDKSGSTYSGKYNGLPLYSDTVNSVVLDTSNYMPANGTSTTNFWIGVKAPSDKVAGTYTNVINFTAIAKILTTNYTITYNDSSTEATGVPSSQSDTITENTNITLSSVEPERDGYTFAGWCTVNNSSDPTTCSGTTYQAGSTYVISNTGGNVTVPLYAVWESAGYNLTYDLTFPSAVPTYVEYYNTSGQWVDINIGTGSHLVGSVTIPTDLASGSYGGTLRIRFTNDAAGSGNTCMVNGETDAYSCPSLINFWWLSANTLINSGYLDVVLIIAGWD